MRVHVITEGRTDAWVLKQILTDAVPFDAFRVVFGEGQYDAVSIARKILVTRPDCVALVVDADTHHAKRIEETRGMLQGSLGAVAEQERFKVILAIPEFETVFFQDKRILTMFPEFSDVEVCIRSEYEPKNVLQKLFKSSEDPTCPKTFEELVERLDLKELQRHPLILELVDFIHAAACTQVESGR